MVESLLELHLRSDTYRGSLSRREKLATESPVWNSNSLFYPPRKSSVWIFRTRKVFSIAEKVKFGIYSKRYNLLPEKSIGALAEIFVFGWRTNWVKLVANKSFSIYLLHRRRSSEVCLARKVFVKLVRVLVGFRGGKVLSRSSSFKSRLHQKQKSLCGARRERFKVWKFIRVEKFVRCGRE